MTRRILLCLFAFSFFLQFRAFSATETYKPEIQPYVYYLQRPMVNPVDYVLDLFERYDMVILCERSHMDVTQYEFIMELVKDPSFIEKVGNIFTEIGTSSIRKRVHAFLGNPNLSKLEIENQLLDIYRNLTWFPLWEKTNYFDFLKGVHELNSTLPAEKMINVFPSDMPFSWEGMTKEKYKAFEDTLDNRDQIMATEVAEKFKELLKSDSRKKALVIMNYRHAFNDFPLYNDQKMKNTGRFLFEAFPGKVANVFIHSLALLPGTTDQHAVTKPIQDGKWDAAFSVMGNQECGFDLSGTPFGKDSFDLFPFTPHKAAYQDVFTGYVFYLPLNRHKQMSGIPGIFDQAFQKTYVQRMEILGYMVSPEELKNIVDNLNSIIEFPYPNVKEIDETIRQWLVAKKQTTE